MKLQIFVAVAAFLALFNVLGWTTIPWWIVACIAIAPFILAAFILLLALILLFIGLCILVIELFIELIRK
jgi:hypothetical protein